MDYGVSYYGSHFTEHIKSDMDALEGTVDYIVYAVSEFSMNFYEGAIRTVIEEAHERGISVYLDLWGFGGALGGEADSRFLMNHPETRQVRNDGKPIARACFNNDTFRDYLSESLKRLIPLGFDGVFIDEPHFYRNKNDHTQWACICDSCTKESGRETYGSDPREVLAFKQRSVVGFISWFSATCKRIAPIPVSLCIYPPGKDPHAPRLTDIARIETIDIIGSDPYWWYFQEPVSFVADVTRTLKKAAGDKRVEIWIQAYKLPSEQIPVIREAVRLARESGADMIAAWTYRGGENSALTCESSESAWEELTRAYRTKRSEPRSKKKSARGEHL